MAPVVRLADDGEWELVTLNWGFVRREADRAARRVVNTRDDQVRGNPFWRESFLTRRCLVPATSYSEPQGTKPATWHWFTVNGDEYSIAVDPWQTLNEVLREDLNLTAQALALRDTRDGVMLPALDNIIAGLTDFARRYKSTPMLAHTHGQPAVPTTFGKEMAVFLARLQKQREKLSAHKFESKWSGAVGNYNALVAGAPDVDWPTFSANFLRGLGLEPAQASTQIIPYDNWLEYFQTLQLTNGILLDLCQDMWRYISDNYLKLRVVPGEVGSSTMPQKVNPIDFENAEGNLGLANALFAHYVRKLPVSRLQRDLSDSTVRRSFGTALGHALVAWTGIARGLDRVEANEAGMRSALEAHWEIIAEGAQTILRATNIPSAYEQLKSLTRGQNITQKSYLDWVEALEVEETVKTSLRSLSPLTYVGLAEEITESNVSRRWKMK